MVQIRFPISEFTLVVTIVSVVTELAFLAAVLLLLKVFSCRQLSRNGKLSIRMYKRKVVLITALVLVIFLAIETVVSSNSKPATGFRMRSQGCLRNIPGSTKLASAILLKSEIDADDGISEAVHFTCTRVTGRVIRHYGGNYSRTTKMIACEREEAYSYTVNDSKLVTLDGNSRKACDFHLCSALQIRGDNLYFNPSSESPMNTEQGKTIKMTPTNISSLPITARDLSVLLERLVIATKLGLRDEGDLRRRTLVGHERSICEFRELLARDKETSIPLAAVIIAIVSWSFSILCWLATLPLMKNVFFDLGNPLHWATRVLHDADDCEGDDPLLCITDDGNGRVLRITGYIPNSKGGKQNNDGEDASSSGEGAKFIL